jgi:glycosyltransferase involved in cell wall biosynthesis
MPLIWRQFPDTEFWIVGSNPPPVLRALAADPRVKVTGFVQDVQTVLCRMSAVLCPWTGTYGFRSRLVEVLALGVPVVATPEAVDGMDLEDGKGLLLGRTDAEAAQQVLSLLEGATFAADQSRFARQQVRTRYSAANTYGRFAQELFDWCAARRLTPLMRPSPLTATPGS